LWFSQREVSKPGTFSGYGDALRRLHTDVTSAAKHGHPGIVNEKLMCQEVNSITLPHHQTYNVAVANAAWPTASLREKKKKKARNAQRSGGTNAD